MSPQVMLVLTLRSTHASIFYFSISMPVIPIQILATPPRSWKWHSGYFPWLFSYSNPSWLLQYWGNLEYPSSAHSFFSPNLSSPLFFHGTRCGLQACWSSNPVRILYTFLSYICPFAALGALPFACKHVPEFPTWTQNLLLIPLYLPSYFLTS